MASVDGNGYQHLPLDGLTVAWESVDGAGHETLSLHFENEAWTAEGFVHGADVQYVFRFNASWHLQQMLLFRDMDDPDLWLANDGRGRWGEVNGSERRDLGGCLDIDLLCSPFTGTMAIRRLNLDIGRSTVVDSVTVDTETLAILRARLDYTRLDHRRWTVRRDDGGPAHEFEVDDYGLVLDLPGRFTRVS